MIFLKQSIVTDPSYWLFYHFIVVLIEQHIKQNFWSSPNDTQPPLQTLYSAWIPFLLVQLSQMGFQGWNILIIEKQLFSDAAGQLLKFPVKCGALNLKIQHFNKDLIKYILGGLFLD